MWRVEDEWFQSSGSGSGRRIYPVDQARECKYALRKYVEEDSRWYAGHRRRVRWAHAVVVPNTDLSHDFDAPDCPRWMIADRTNLTDLGEFLRNIPRRQETNNGVLEASDVDLSSTSSPAAASASAPS